MFRKKKEVFYEYFLLVMKNIKLGVDVFEEQLNNLDKVDDIHLKLKTVEQMGDQYTHEIITQLNKSFITPLEREDILALTLKLDDVMDGLEVCGSRLELYNVREGDDYFKLFLTNIKMCVNEINAAIELLVEKKLPEMKKHTHKINDLENAGDEIWRDAIKTLFTTCKDPIEIIKKKEIYTVMESISDACEDVADALESIIMGNT